ncbi:hypothetical protein BH10PSE19_BH10PSE19_02810 [soil metagenome]
MTKQQLKLLTFTVILCLAPHAEAGGENHFNLKNNTNVGIKVNHQNCTNGSSMSGLPGEDLVSKADIDVKYNWNNPKGACHRGFDIYTQGGNLGCTYRIARGQNPKTGAYSEYVELTKQTGTAKDPVDNKSIVCPFNDNKIHAMNRDDKSTLLMEFKGK